MKSKMVPKRAPKTGKNRQGFLGTIFNIIQIFSKSKNILQQELQIQMKMNPPSPIEISFDKIQETKLIVIENCAFQSHLRDFQQKANKILLELCSTNHSPMSITFHNDETNGFKTQGFY